MSPSRRRSGLLVKIQNTRVQRLLMGLTMTVIILAFNAHWDDIGRLLTLIPDEQPGPWAVTTGDGAADAENNSRNSFMVLRKMIECKLEYKPREAPRVAHISEINPQFSVFPREYLPAVRSPCWYEEFSEKPGTNPYRSNQFTRIEAKCKGVLNQLSAHFHEHLYHRGGKQFRLRCLPYFYLIGQPKCGTTDLFAKLQLHPVIKFNIFKEPHWWTRRRFKNFIDPYHVNGVSVRDYLDLFDLAARNIYSGGSGRPSMPQILTGDASSTSMWLNLDWEDEEPRFLTMDLIHTVTPSARIIIILRDPVERLYSDYLFFTESKKSPEIFHQQVVQSIRVFHHCLYENSLRHCTYNYKLFLEMKARIVNGMYVVYLLDWLALFPRDQILVVRLEDYHADLEGTLKKVFDFLKIAHLPNSAKATLKGQYIANSRRAVDRKVGQMLPATRDLLTKLYEPFNQRLAAVLDNKGFLWRSTAPRQRLNGSESESNRFQCSTSEDGGIWF